MPASPGIPVAPASPGVADARIERELLAQLEREPADVVALCAAALAVAPSAFGVHEGAIHALLHRLVRSGRVVVAGRVASGAALYAASGASKNGARVLEAPVPAPTPPPTTASESRVALFVASKVRDPEDRGRVVADVLAHRTALAAERRLADFGHTKLARELLRRVDRGRFAIACPDSPWERVIRFVRHEGLSLVLTLGVLLLVWLYVADFRVVPSPSMEPGIKPRDRLLVWIWNPRALPERWQVLVFRKSDTDDTPYIKRVAGLPGETIAIDDGDLLVNGVVATKPDDLREFMKEPLVRATFDERGRADGWSTGSDGWRALARPLFADEPTYFDEFGKPERPAPPRPVAHDVYATFECQRGASVRIRFLDEQHRLSPRDAGEIVCTRVPSGEVVLTQLASKPHAAAVMLASGHDRGPDSQSFTLSVVDGVLRLSSTSLRYEGPLAVTRPLGAVHAEVDVSGAVHSIAIDRDIHYTQPPQAQYAIDPATPFRIPDDRVFMLGDHSAYSRDSRFIDVGPVALSRVLGRAIFRVWPFTRVGLVH